jgi:two-component system, cell cycle response regulator
MRICRMLLLAAFAFLVAHLAFGLGGPSLDHFTERWLYDGLELVAGAACLARAAATRHERVAWAVLGVGVLSFAIGDICFDFVYGGNPPGVSICDAFYLAFYAACYAALGLLVRSRVASFGRGVWLDGLIAALAVTALSASIVLEDVLKATHGNRTTMIVDLAYPVADLVLLGIVILVFVLSGSRPGRAWMVVAVAFAVITLADSLFMYLNSTGGYSEGTMLDALWPAAMLLLAVAAWAPAARVRPLDLEARFAGLTPLLCGALALGVLVEGRFSPHNVVADGLAVAALLLVLVRTAVSFADNGRLLEVARAQSLTDHLTGLGNRRALMLALERELDSEPRVPTALVLYDLNGFKRYNDTFGHPSGDVLLTRLAERLAGVVGDDGGAYRLGGDEFCLLAPAEPDGIAVIAARGGAALTENGEGFRVTTEYGAVLLPEEASDPTSALHLADERLYARKHGLAHPGEQAHEALLHALGEREPDLREHMRRVARLSTELGIRLGFEGHLLEQLRLAASLHDIGKLAIPESVLQKPGALTEREWHFVRQHTIVGQRLIAGTPAMQEVGRIVRATHERWDGRGYVDGLATSSIPAAARIIAICDAYAAMTSNRPYRRALTPAEALVELRRGAGAQFDPEVVFVFCRAHDDIVGTSGDGPSLVAAIG